MIQEYHSNGKFLLTGEYLVLKGALALALPLKMGQTMTVETVSTPSLQWNAHQPKGPWFSVILDPKTLDIISCDNPAKAEKLVQILKASQKLNPDAFSNSLRLRPVWTSTPTGVSVAAPP